MGLRTERGLRVSTAACLVHQRDQQRAADPEPARLGQHGHAADVPVGQQASGPERTSVVTPGQRVHAQRIPTTRRIILGDTLLSEFTTDEIETVLAHELGHHVHKDIPFGIAIETISTVVGLWMASLALSWGVGYFGFQDVGDIAALPLFMLVMGLYGLLTMPLGNAFSRWREVRADRYALDSTGNGPAFASAMTRLANQNLAEVDPEPWVEFLLYSHPALEKRIAMAEGYQAHPQPSNQPT